MRTNKIADLIKQLDTQGDIEAERVIQLLTKHGAEAIPLLSEAAKNLKAPRIRKWSLQALGAFEDKAVLPILYEALQDKQMTVRLHAARGIARIGDETSVPKIAELLKDSSSGIRGNALHVLMKIGAPASKQVAPLLKDSAWHVRQLACKACGQFGWKKFIPDLKLLLEDEKKAVRNAAEAALQELQGS